MCDVFVPLLKEGVIVFEIILWMFQENLEKRRTSLLVQYVWVARTHTQTRTAHSKQRTALYSILPFLLRSLKGQPSLIPNFGLLPVGMRLRVPTAYCLQHEISEFNVDHAEDTTALYQPIMAISITFTI